MKNVEKVPRTPLVYNVQDLIGEILGGTFYGADVKKLKFDNDLFVVEKVLRKRRPADGRTKYFVRLGYPKKFDSWKTNLVVIYYT